ncbi:MAG: mechanosensitive ion channel [Chitinophagales bacterium]|nr:mechanosensitive ion channel [Bacteroidota bacterium]MCB9042419.1 mechanosensitive ion channel [Chitinophagales bacterium]
MNLLQIEIFDKISLFFNSFIQKIANGAPVFFGALAILLVGYFIAKFVSRSITKLLEVAQVDKLLDKLKTIDLFSHFNFELSKVIGKFLYWIIILIFVVLASETLGLHSVSDGIGKLFGYLPYLASAMGFFIIGTFIANLIRNFITTTAESFGLSTGRIIGNIVFYFLLVMVAITSLNQAGVNTEIITENMQIILGAMLFSLAIGYALGSKALMSNMLGAFYSKGKFEVGQTIRFDNVQGKIVNTDSTSMTLKTSDRLIIIPLSQLVERRVEILDE